MKIVLLTLSGNADLARERLAARFPDAAVESMARAQFEKGSVAARTSALRRRQPEVFAVATERLVWQRGQDAFLLLGALAGARQSILLDMHNGWREESKADVLLRAPVRLARDFAGVMRRCDVPRANCGSSRQRWNASRTDQQYRDQPARLRG